MSNYRAGTDFLIGSAHSFRGLRGDDGDASEDPAMAALSDAMSAAAQDDGGGDQGGDGGPPPQDDGIDPGDGGGYGGLDEANAKMDAAEAGQGGGDSGGGDGGDFGSGGGGGGGGYDPSQSAPPDAGSPLSPVPVVPVPDPSASPPPGGGMRALPTWVTNPSLPNPAVDTSSSGSGLRQAMSAQASAGSSRAARGAQQTAQAAQRASSAAAPAAAAPAMAMRSASAQSAAPAAQRAQAGAAFGAFRGLRGSGSLYRTGTDVLGAISDSATDYDYGEKQVTELVQYFNELKRPKDFEGAVEAVYAAYQKNKAFEPIGRDAVLRWKNATGMKQVGADASKLMEQIQAKYPTQTSAAPSGGSSAVYVPGVDRPSKSIFDSFSLGSIPWWLWAGGAVLVTGVGFVFLAPVIGGAFARHRLARS